MRVMDHDYITVKYWGLAHYECNLNLRLKVKNSLLCFVSCKNMIHLLSFKKCENMILEGHTKNKEKYLTCTIEQPKKKEIKPGVPSVFIYSTHFSK